MRLSFYLSTAISLLIATAPYAMADEDLPFGYVRSIDAMNSGFSTANSIGLAAEYASMRRNFDQAIALCKRAIKLNDDDLDIHKAYAKALEGKLRTSREMDPELYNECVKEWLLVYRNEVGVEKGLNGANGLGLPLANKIMEDEEGSILAGIHLKLLTGRIPKQRETDAKFLKQTLKPAELKVTAKILPKSVQPTSQPAPPTLWLK